MAVGGAPVSRDDGYGMKSMGVNRGGGAGAHRGSIGADGVVGEALVATNRATAAGRSEVENKLEGDIIDSPGLLASACSFTAARRFHWAQRVV